MTDHTLSRNLPREVNPLSVLGFLLSLSFFFSGMGAIICAISLEQFRGYSGNEIVGKKLAFAGLIIGIILSFLCMCYYIIVLLNAPAWSRDVNQLLYYLF